MEILNLVIDVKASLGNKFLFFFIRPSYKYENGKRLDEIEGYKYDIVLPERKYEKMSVKISGEARFPYPVENPINVEFEGLKLKPYWYSGRYDVSATASNITKVVKRE